MLQYDNSAFYFFALSFITLYLIPCKLVSPKFFVCCFSFGFSSTTESDLSNNISDEIDNLRRPRNSYLPKKKSKMTVHVKVIVFSTLVMIF